MKKSLTYSSLILSIGLASYSFAAANSCPIAIQVYASHTASTASHYIQAHNTQDLKIIKQSTPDQRDIYKVVHGCYSDHQSALHDLKKMQAQTNGAWITKINPAASASKERVSEANKATRPTPNVDHKTLPNTQVSKTNHMSTATRKKVATKRHEVINTVKSTLDHKSNVIATTHKTIIIKKHIIKHTPKATFTINDGSLMKNAYKFGKEFNYHVIWDVTDKNSGAKADYEWVGKTAVTRTNPLSIIHMMMTTYPVNVKVWNANRVICITNTGSCDE